MALDWFAGIGQTVAGGIATAATLGQVEEVKNWTSEGAKKVTRNTDKTWGKDGELTKLAEAFPLTGFIASAGHAIAGDEQQARRAAATATKSALVVGSAIGGVYVGGPAGAAVAAAGKTVGEYAEIGINPAIDEESRRADGTFRKLDGKEFVKIMTMDAALQGLTAARAASSKSADRGFQGTSLEYGGREVKRDTARYGAEPCVYSAFRQSATAASKPFMKTRHSQARGRNHFRNSRKSKSFSL